MGKCQKDVNDVGRGVGVSVLATSQHDMMRACKL